MKNSRDRNATVLMLEETALRLAAAREARASRAAGKRSMDRNKKIVIGVFLVGFGLYVFRARWGFEPPPLSCDPLVHKRDDTTFYQKISKRARETGLAFTVAPRSLLSMGDQLGWVNFVGWVKVRCGEVRVRRGDAERGGSGPEGQDGAPQGNTHGAHAAVGLQQRRWRRRRQRERERGRPRVGREADSQGKKRGGGYLGSGTGKAASTDTSPWPKPVFTEETKWEDRKTCEHL